jgi:hypothetical protein
MIRKQKQLKLVTVLTGDIFKDKDNFVYKIFKSGKYHPVFNPQANNIVRAIFDSERIAYEIASKSNALREITPEYYGSFDFDRIEDAKGTDLTEIYCKSCCFKIKFINGDFRSDFNKNKDLRDKYLAIFVNNGIQYTEDMSYAIIENSPIFIDFAMRSPV